MTETPANHEGSGSPEREGIDSASAEGQSETDPALVPNAPDRDPERDPERRSKAAPEDPEDRPGPLAPGAEQPDSPRGVESFERPGRDGNWEQPEG